MKRYFTILIYLFTINAMFGQSLMNLFIKNGEVLRIPTTKIDTVKFTTDAPPFMVVIYNHTDTFLSSTNEIDSITYSELTQNYPPTVLTLNTSNITSNTCIVTADAVYDSGDSISTKGICWSISPNPTILDNNTVNGSGLGKFTAQITGILPSTTYYVRSYAVNSNGNSYGNTLSFTTIQLATLFSSTVTNIDTTFAKAGGVITSDGGSAITQRGVCWSTSSSPTIANNKTLDSVGVGTFQSNVTGLIPGTTYYLKAYATNNAGTSYGDVVLFNTKPRISIPTLSTSIASNVSSSNAISGGVISNDGGAAVTQRGVCWSTSLNPTIDNNKTIDGSGIGTFSSNINGLSSNTTYYIRAYATNSVGIAYGNNNIFSTCLGNLCIGDTYMGGIIVYILQPLDPGYDPNTPHGLIMSSSNINALTFWGCFSSLIGGTSTSIGTGSSNTSIIVNSCGGVNAAQKCNDLVLNGYSDWYLPSINELIKANDVYIKGIGGLSQQTFYFSSSETSSYYAWGFRFNDGYKFNQVAKNLASYVRAFRSF